MDNDALFGRISDMSEYFERKLARFEKRLEVLEKEVKKLRR